MQISGAIVDWNCQAQLSIGLWSLDHCQGGDDSFTRLNDSFVFNDDFGSLFLLARNELPAKSADILERFLVNICPSIFSENMLRPDSDLDSPLEWVYSAQSPQTVRARLASLYDINLLEFCRMMSKANASRGRTSETVIEGAAEIINFVFMWAAAHGQAASKNWGLIVGVG